MTENKVRSLVTEAVSLDREIEEMTRRRKEIEADLKVEAKSREEDQTPTDGGGWSVTFEGSDGCICRVTQSGPKLKSSVSSEGDVAKLKSQAGALFGQLFAPSVTYKPVANFRDRASDLLGKAAGKLIKLCTSPGAVSVSYETKEVA